MDDPFFGFDFPLSIGTSCWEGHHPLPGFPSKICWGWQHEASTSRYIFISYLAQFGKLPMKARHVRRRKLEEKPLLLCVCYTYFYDIYLLAMAEREKEESDWPQRNTSVARGRQRGIWKGDGDGSFLTGNSSGVECVVILGSIYSALGGSDEWI